MRNFIIAHMYYLSNRKLFSWALWKGSQRLPPFGK